MTVATVVGVRVDVVAVKGNLEMIRVSRYCHTKEANRGLTKSLE